MNFFLIKLCILFFFTILLSVGIQAQNSRFIYIQSENKQPFFVKVDKKMITSSVTGYMIIPKLTDNTYDLTVGFPQNEWPPLNVTVDIMDPNTGMVLKRTGNNNWALGNLNTWQPKPSGNRDPVIKDTVIISEVDEFARILAQVVNDPSIAGKSEVKENKEAKPIAVDETTIKTAVVKEEIIPVAFDPAIPDSGIGRSVISKLKQDKTSEGVLITYIDAAASNADTVKVFIPVMNSDSAEEKKAAPVINPSINNTQNTGSYDSKFLNMELQNPNAKIDSGSAENKDFVITEKKAVINNPAVEIMRSDTVALDSNTAMINHLCKRMANENDFLNLRKDMAAEANEKEMNKTANKQFVETCFSTGQIKNLGVLFISEAERFDFYSTAYPFVWDKHNFTLLEDQLTDNNYKARFKAMLSN